MSRKQEILEAAALLGLAVVHVAAWGEANREATSYASRAREALDKKALNPAQKATVRTRGIKRAQEYIQEHTRAGTIPAGDAAAILSEVAARIDAEPNEV